MYHINVTHMPPVCFLAATPRKRGGYFTTHVLNRPHHKFYDIDSPQAEIGHPAFGPFSDTTLLHISFTGTYFIHVHVVHVVVANITPESHLWRPSTRLLGSSQT